MSNLVPVLHAVQAAMDARLAGLTHLFGPQYLKAEGAPNRAVWVPVSDDFQPGRQHRGQNVDRILRTRVARVMVQLWGVPTSQDGAILTRENQAAGLPSGARGSVEQVEAMMEAVICALQDVAQGGVQYDIASGDWDDTTGESIGQYGLMYLLTFTLRLDVPYEERDHGGGDPGAVTGILTTYPE
jgi:hypothetical protein